MEVSLSLLFFFLLDVCSAFDFTFQPDTRPTFDALLSELSSPPANLNDSQRTRAGELCCHIRTNDQLPKGFLQRGDGAVFKAVVQMLFTSSGSARKEAKMFLDSVAVPPRDFTVSWLVDELKGDGPFYKLMESEVAAKNPHGLHTWGIVIRLLDSVIRHSDGTPLLNRLLAIAQDGFKSVDEDIREQTFIEWKTLIDNFATESAVINNAKRIKLLTRPLAVRTYSSSEEPK